MNLTKITETSSTITLGWTPPTGVGGYVLYANGQVASVATANMKDGSPRKEAKFSKTNPGPPFHVVAVVRSNSGAYSVDVGSYADTPPPPTGKTWESEAARLAPAPAFTPTRTLTARTPTEFNSALSSLRAGDRLDAIGFDYNGTLSIRDKDLSGFAEIHATGVRLRGVPQGSAGYGLVLWNSPKIRMYGFDVTNPGGYGIAMFDAVDNELRDFKIHDCGASGIQVCPSSSSYPSHRACERLVVIAEIWNCGLDYSHDPHAEKGTGLHGAYIGKDGSATPYPVKNSTFCFDVHDQPAGAGAQSTHMEDCIWVLRAKRLTMRSVSQVSGNAFQCFGTAIQRNRFAYIETEDTQGKAFDTSNFSSSTALVSNTVEYGRASNYCLNPRFGTAPWDSHGGVQYEDVEPALFGPG